jgi:hypothetical protein
MELYNIQADVKEIRVKDVDWILLTQNSVQRSVLGEDSNEISDSIKHVDLFYHLSNSMELSNVEICLN